MAARDFSSQNSEIPRWRHSRWRDDREWPNLMAAGGICEDTGAWVTENGECPVHHGDACLYRSDVLVVALRELEAERLQMLVKQAAMVEVLRWIRERAEEHYWTGVIKRIDETLAELRPEARDGSS